MKRLIVSSLIALSAICCFAVDIATCDDDIFAAQMDSLVRQGQEYYEKADINGMEKVIVELSNSLFLRRHADRIAETDYLYKYYLARHDRLTALYYYDLSEYDAPNLLPSCGEYLYKVLGTYKNDPDFSDDLTCAPLIHQDLAVYHYRLKDYQKALEHLQEAYDKYYAVVNNTEDGEPQPEDVAELQSIMADMALCKARLSHHDEALKIMGQLKYPQKDKDYYEALRKHAKIWMLSDRSERADKALPMYREYLKFRKDDSLDHLVGMTPLERQDYWLYMRPFFADCYRLEGKDPGLLYDVTLFGKGLVLEINTQSRQNIPTEKTRKSLAATWQQVQKALKKGDCAIEFIQYEKADSQCMAALVLRESGKPKWIEISSPDAVFNYSPGYYTVQERVYSMTGDMKNKMYSDSILYEMIWTKPLQEAIAGSKRVYFAPDGYIHQIAIEYMLPDDIAGAEFYRLTSTRRLLEKRKVKTDAALLIGGVDYDTNTNDRREENDSDNDAYAYRYLKSLGSSFPYLKGTREECLSINDIRSNKNDILLSGSSASETMFRKLCYRYPIIALATHGYYGAATVPQGTDLRPMGTDNTLSECSVALTGANASLNDEYFDTDNYDGIISALELSKMDLSNVDLMILSACQTGLGRVTADGVFGMQRGLKNAGVGSMMVSLWSVSDLGTSMLMTEFHKALSYGASPHEALAKARKALMATDTNKNVKKRFNASKLIYDYDIYDTVSQPNYNKPQYYNAFILIDAID